MAHKFVAISPDSPQMAFPPVMCRNCHEVYGTMPAGVLDVKDNGDMTAIEAFVINPRDKYKVVYQAAPMAPRPSTPIPEVA